MSKAPVRVVRKGPLKWFHPTREELRAACQYAEAEARPIRGMTEMDLIHFLNDCIGSQLGVGVSCTMIGHHDIQDAPVIRIMTEHYTHHIAVRGIQLKPEEPTAMEKALEDPAKFVKDLAKEVAKLLPSTVRAR
jgi:hypothetical protein